jgi:putative transposase
MRYAQRGGYTPAEQQRRERLRLEAAGRFARGDKIGEIARDLRVTQGVGAAVAPGLAGRRG